jgi:hypothetical protein
MNRMALLVGLLVALGGFWLFAPSRSAAQEEVSPEAGASPGEVQTIYKKTTIIDFSDVTITGELTKPEGSYLMNKKKTNFDLLIRVRDNFLPEMIKTVDNL